MQQGNPFTGSINLLHINGSESTQTAYQMAIAIDTGAKKERIKVSGVWADWREFALCEAENTGFDNAGTDLSSIDVQSAIVEVNTKTNTATLIAQGKNSGHVFEDFNDFLASSINLAESVKIGDNFYIADNGVSDFWLYAKDLEDLNDYSSFAELDSEVASVEYLDTEKFYFVGTSEIGINVFCKLAADKVDLTDYLTEIEISTILDDYYTETEANALLDTKLGYTSGYGKNHKIDSTYVVVNVSSGVFNLLLQTGTTNININWADGSAIENNVVGGTIAHTYASAGIYEIEISGTFQGFNVNNDATYKTMYIALYGYSNFTITGANALYGCNNLMIAKIPYTTTISSGTFYDCSKLFKIDINSVANLGADAFRGCSKLTDVAIPNITILDARVFYGCSSLTTIVCPKATSVGASTFNGCLSLARAYLPKVTTIIPTAAFYNCGNLRDLTLGIVTTTSSSLAFSNVVLDRLVISGNPTPADITRIKKFYYKC